MLEARESNCASSLVLLLCCFMLLTFVKFHLDIQSQIDLPLVDLDVYRPFICCVLISLAYMNGDHTRAVESPLFR